MKTLLLLSLLLAACSGSTSSPSDAGIHAGDACGSPQDRVCADENTMLACNHSVYTNVPCAPHGCANASGIVTCDYATAMPGAACAVSDEGLGRCDAIGNPIQCRDGFFATGACSPTTCHQDGNSVACQ